jgi:peptidoglycan-associated lipoprotein
MRTLRSVLPLLLATAGCAHKAPARADQPPTAATAGDANRALADGASKGTHCSSDFECGDGQLCIDNACVPISDHLAACNEVRIGFAFDSSEIDPGERPALERSARCLKADRALHVRVEGNADERGTEEYNLALGDRRATQVAKYLGDLGVSQAQLKTVSYGKERPLCVEHDEACWAKNRRADVNLARSGAR